MKISRAVIMIMLAVMVTVSTFVFAVPASAALQEKESNNSFATANNVEAGQSITGNFGDKNDKDFYVFKAKSNGLLSIDFVHEYADSTLNWDIDLFYCEEPGKYTGIDNTNGFMIIRPNNDERYTILTTGVTSGDTIYVEVHSNNSKVIPVDYTLEYNFTETNDYETERNDSFATATKLKTGNTINGNLCVSGDLDYYSFVPEENGTYEFVFTHEYSSKNYIWEVVVYKYENSNYVKQNIDLRGGFIKGNSAERVSIYKFDAKAGERYYVEFYMDVMNSPGGTKPFPVLFYGIECDKISSTTTEKSTTASTTRTTTERYEETTPARTTTEKWSEITSAVSSTAPRTTRATSKPSTTKINNETTLNDEDSFYEETPDEDEFYTDGYEEESVYGYEEYEDGEFYDDEEADGDDYYQPAPGAKTIAIVAVSAIALVAIATIAIVYFSKKSRNQ